MRTVALLRSTLPAAVLVLAGAGTAWGNGRIPRITGVHFQPQNDSRIVLPTTAGLLLSEDDGASFHWICEETVGYGGTFDPDYALTASGDIYATSLTGLRRSTDDGCSFLDTELCDDPTGGDSPVLLEDHYVGDVEVGDDGKRRLPGSVGRIGGRHRY